MKSRYVSLSKNQAGSPENKKISYPGKGTRFGKHLFITYLKIEYTLCLFKVWRKRNINARNTQEKSFSQPYTAKISVDFTV